MAGCPSPPPAATRPVSHPLPAQEGEEALRFFPCTYRTISPCTLWMLRWRDLRALLDHHDHLRTRLSAHALQAMGNRLAQFPEHWSNTHLKARALAVRRRRRRCCCCCAPNPQGLLPLPACLPELRAPLTTALSRSPPPPPSHPRPPPHTCTRGAPRSDATPT